MTKRRQDDYIESHERSRLGVEGKRRMRERCLKVAGIYQLTPPPKSRRALQKALTAKYDQARSRAIMRFHEIPVPREKKIPKKRDRRREISSDQYLAYEEERDRAMGLTAPTAVVAEVAIAAAANDDLNFAPEPSEHQAVDHLDLGTLFNRQTTD